MKATVKAQALAATVALLVLAASSRAQNSAGPWQDCDQPVTHVTVASDALLPAISQGQRLLATCFTHAIIGSSLVAGQVRLESLSPPLARGDLVAFRRPDDISQTAIRRVIALPGDRVQVRDYRVLVNDTLLPTDRIGEDDITGTDGRRIAAVRMHETMRHGIVGYDILIPPNSTDGSGTSEAIRVPQRFIFVLADNRATAPNITAPGLNLVPVVNLIARLDVPRSK